MIPMEGKGGSLPLRPLSTISRMNICTTNPTIQGQTTLVLSAFRKLERRGKEDKEEIVPKGELLAPHLSTALFIEALNITSQNVVY